MTTDPGSTTDVPEAVTFDFWNTLCVPDNERYRAARMAAVQGVLTDLGAEVDEEGLTQAFVVVFERFNERWAANEQFTYVEAAAMLAERFAPGCSTAQQAVLADACGYAGREAVPGLTENVASALRTLHDQGVRVGIICDVGMSPSPVLRGFLEHHGVLDLFDHWSFSDEVGVYKPHREIFEHALAGLGGVAPERAAHIGDLLRTDVAGARAMGMTAVRYRGAHDDGGGVGDVGELVEAHHVVDDHGELASVLGLAE